MYDMNPDLKGIQITGEVLKQDSDKEMHLEWKWEEETILEMNQELISKEKKPDLVKEVLQDYKEEITISGMNQILDIGELTT